MTERPDLPHEVAIRADGSERDYCNACGEPWPCEASVNPTERPEERCPDCREGDFIRDLLVQIGGIEAHVTTEPPLVKNIWTEAFTCPTCDRTWYAEPTPEQRMQWTKDGVA